MHAVTTGKAQLAEKPSGDTPKRKSLTVWVPEELARAFKVLAAEQGRPMQDLLTEILNDGLQKFNKPRID